MPDSISPAGLVRANRPAPAARTVRFRRTLVLLPVLCALSRAALAQGAAPVITTVAAVNLTPGAPVAYTTQATNSPTSYAATGLPRGLTCDAATGMISGVTGTAGNFVVTLRATNAAGTGTATQAMSVEGPAPIEMPYVRAAVAPAAGTHHAGDVLTIVLEVDAPYGGLAVTGAPRIALTLGTATRYANFVAVDNSSARPQLTFRYVVAPGDSAPAGITIAPAIEQNGGTIRDRTGLFCALGLPDMPAGGVQVAAATPAAPPAISTSAPAFATVPSAPRPAPAPSAPPVKSAQTIEFVSPVGAMTIGQPIQLGATSSSGLPITYSVVGGNATLAGNVLTPRAGDAIVVRASQAGSDRVTAASVDVTFGVPQKAAQAIAFPPLENLTADARPIALHATASSGLPVTYALVSGPATLRDGELALSGAAGTVVVRAMQAGDASFGAADAIERSFAVRAPGQQVYIGRSGTDVFGAAIAQDGTHGALVARLATTGEMLVARFAVDGGGLFTAKATRLAAPGANVADPAAQRTVVGAVRDGVLNARIAELGLDFTATVLPPFGACTAVAGLYTGRAAGSASGEIYLFVSGGGDSLAIAPATAGIASAAGTIGADGRFAFTTASGVVISGAVDAASGVFHATVADAGVTRDFAGLNAATGATDRLVNLSSRFRIAPNGARSFIAGFVVAGDKPRTMLVRAVGPGLGAFGVGGTLANPRLQIFDSSGKLAAENDDWSDDATVAATAERVGAFRLPAGSRDAALVANLPPGAYTAVAGGAGEGVVLVEVFDATEGSAVRTQELVNLSTRGHVDTGEGVLVGGFVVTGNAPKRVLVRGIGPGLAGFGVTDALVDPVLRIFQDGRLVAQNDNWTTPQPLDAAHTAATGAEIAAAATATGAFPLAPASRDAAILVTLAPGAYSAIVSGAGNSTGAGLVEVYEVSGL